MVEYDTLYFSGLKDMEERRALVHPHGDRARQLLETFLLGRQAGDHSLAQAAPLSAF